MHTNGDFTEMIIARCRKEITEFHNSLADAHEKQMAWWQQLAGDALEEMLQSRPAAEAHLRNSNPKIRLAALSVLANHWNATADKQFGTSCEALIHNDRAADVRAAAVTWLGACYDNSKDGRIAKLLAGMVCDVAESTEVRCSAYDSLCSVFAVPFELSLAQVDVGGGTGFPHGVDWKFVSRCLQGEEQGNRI
jgi:hypothetical protein